MTRRCSARVMFLFKGLVEENIDQLAQMITSEHGKTLANARAR